MTAGTPGDHRDGMGLTRWRDLAVVALVAAVIGYLLVRWNYHRLPPLPTAAGVIAGVIGVGEAIYGWGLRSRIRDAGRTGKEPVEPLLAARAVAVAKATALAAAALGGLWIGVLGYTLPMAGDVVAAAHDRTTALIGLGCAVAMLAGALFLERSCRTPDEPRRDETR